MRLLFHDVSYISTVRVTNVVWILSAEVNSSESYEKKILLNMPLIKTRLTFLTKIINGRTDLEIEVLFAVQVVMHKNDFYTGEWKHHYNLDVTDYHLLLSQKLPIWKSLSIAIFFILQKQFSYLYYP